MVNLIVCGINHHGTAVAIRERLTMPESCLPHAVRSLKEQPGIQEAVLLSTCNRFEVYAVADSAEVGLKQLSRFLASARQVPGHEALVPNLRLLRDDAALQLFRVSSGLDSMVIGESHILSQVKKSIQASAAAGGSGPVLQRLFDIALRCGKGVRSGLALSRKAVSVPSAAIELAARDLGALRNKKVLVVGAGVMGRLCVKHLLGKTAAQNITMFNRSPERLAGFECEFPLVSVRSDEHRLPQLIEDADLVIVATAAQKYVVTPAMLTAGRKLLIDISVPRNIDPAAAHLPGITLHNIDDLRGVVAENLRERQQLAEQAEPFLMQSLNEFNQWLSSYQLAPMLASFRERVRVIGDRHAARYADCEGFDVATARLIGEILHTPTVRLRESGNVEYARVLNRLFGTEV